MTYKIRGEVEVESGLGLPRLTTLARTAYQPPADGFVVFDTDLKRICVWDATNMLWVVSADQGQVNDKIDILDGIGKNSLSLQDINDIDVVKFSTNSTLIAIGGEGVVGTDYIMDSDTITSGTMTLSQDNSVQTSTSGTTYSTIRASVDTQQSSGKWYWETLNVGTDPGGAVQARAAGITLLSNPETAWAGSPDTTGISYAVWGYNGGLYHNAIIVASVAVHLNDGQIVRHKLDLDAGTYEVAVDGGGFVLFEASLPAGIWAPVFTTRGGSAIGVNFRSADLTYAVPGGFTVLAEGGTMLANLATQEFFYGGVNTAQFIAGADNLSINLQGGSSVSLETDHILADSPIHGVDGNDPTSLVTKAYVDGYDATFVVADWIAGSPNTFTVTQATHGITGPFVVSVQELSGGVYESVNVETEYAGNGNVVVKTVGAVFDGRIFIS